MADDEGRPDGQEHQSQRENPGQRRTCQGEVVSANSCCRRPRCRSLRVSQQEGHGAGPSRSDPDL